jgi:hypothetical protein
VIWVRLALVALGLVEGAWMTFDGSRALAIGDKVDLRCLRPDLADYRSRARGSIRMGVAGDADRRHCYTLVSAGRNNLRARAASGADLVAPHSLTDVAAFSRVPFVANSGRAGTARRLALASLPDCSPKSYSDLHVTALSRSRKNATLASSNISWPLARRAAHV